LVSHTEGVQQLGAEKDTGAKEGAINRKVEEMAQLNSIRFIQSALSDV